jgi:hypothetical protein
LLIYDTAGDPITGLKWTKKTPQKISDELRKESINVSADTVKKILTDMNYSLKVNYKKIESNPNKVTKQSKIKRNQQFEYIEQLRTEFLNEQNPIISTDAKKRELVGNFKNPGAIWCQDGKKVNAYDFRSLAIGVAIPYGIYNILANTGFVVIGISYNTAEFAVSSIAKWWNIDGNQRYSNKNSILIQADGGGSNGARSKLWKACIQNILCNQYHLIVTVCHYPPGTSKYNPIEHRLFSEISKNWAGEPLKDYETILKYIKTTKTSTGLEVNSVLDKTEYEKGIKVSDKEMNKINIEYHEILPEWNYTIYPSKSEVIFR